jgi:predicted O-methyltransferase YrrM
MKELDFLSFVREKSGSKKEFLLELENYAHTHHVPIIKPETARFLEVVCRILKPSKILEIGTAIGYSSMVMADVLQKNVLIDTIEISPNKVKLARENIEKYGYSNCIRVIFGDGEDVLRNIEKEYDLIFLDGAKGQYIQILPLCKNHLHQNGVLLTDNVFCQGLLLDLDSIGRKKRTMVRNMNQYIDEILANEPLSTLIPLGDGILMSVKESAK